MRDFVRVLVLVLVGTARLYAQGAEDAQVTLARERVRAAEAALAAYTDSVARTQGRLDTLDLGDVVFLVSPETNRDVRTAAEAALRTIRTVYGKRTALLRTLPAANVVVRATTWQRSSGDGRPGSPRYSITSNEDISLKQSDIPRDSVRLRMALEWRFFEALKRMPGVLSRWAGTGLPYHVASDAQWALRRIELMSVPATIAHDCVSGALISCELALRLRPGNDPVVEWYDAAWRRRFVDDRLYDLRRRFPRETYRCRLGLDAACVSMLRQIGAGTDPLSSDLNVSLIEEAMRLGGAGALERAGDSTATPGELIAAIAGVPLDSVITSWRHHVLTVRPPSEVVTPAMVGVSLLWIAGFATLASRSARWR
jgi:hypothetical protein